MPDEHAEAVGNALLEALKSFSKPFLDDHDLAAAQGAMIRTVEFLHQLCQDKERVEALRAALIEADEEYAKPCPDDEALAADPELEHPQRVAVVKTVDAIVDYLRLCIPDAPRIVLLNLYAALADVDKGRPSSLLKCRKLRGKGNRMSLMDDQERAWAAASVTALMRKGYTEKDVLDSVATDFGLDGKTLKRYRKNMKDRPAAIQKFYRNTLKMYEGTQDSADAQADET